MRDHLPAAVNPLGLGHFANHFPQGGHLPSLAYITFDIPLDFPPALSVLIPNVYWSADHLATSSVLTSAVALIAMRDVADEELFVDYGFVGAAR